jgi:molecular chaperone GrpE
MENQQENIENNPKMEENNSAEESTQATEQIEKENTENTVAGTEDKVAELNDKYLRLYSEFENYKRRTARERMELTQTAAKEFFVSLLPVIDDFERAIKSIDSATDVNALKEGVDLIYQKFTKTLFTKGLEVMDVKEKEFDADIHEAITSIPSPTEELKGKVVDELEKGYLLNGKVIRFAKVVVGN